MNVDNVGSRAFAPLEAHSEGTDRLAIWGKRSEAEGLWGVSCRLREAPGTRRHNPRGDLAGTRWFDAQSSIAMGFGRGIASARSDPEH